MAHTPRIHRWVAATMLGGITVLTVSAPASARLDEGTPASSESSGTIVREVEVPVEDSGLEYVQIGTAALAGMALTGAAIVGGRRLRGHPQAA